MLKAELRREYLAKRKAFTGEQVVDGSRRIFDRALSEINLSKARTIHCFLSTPKFNEVETSILFQRIWNEFPGTRTAVPRVDREADELVHVLYTRETELAESKWGIREPVGGETVEPEEIDLIFVPLICFDTSLHRVGYGKGYYDRFLRRCRRDALKAGVSLFGPSDPIDDIHDGDFPLDLCITPDKIYLPDR
jgi:5-formyltetrahydrofolate cyclo-ligase